MNTCYLYRHFDADEKLLYVGITNRIGLRLQKHFETSAWRDSISKITIEKFPNRTEALKAESSAIYHEEPVWNSATLANAQRRVIEQNKIISEMLERDCGYREIASAIGVSRQTITNRVKKYHLP